jgi:hypothetical protein
MQIFGTTEQRHEERLSLATFAAYLPRAVQTDLGKWAMVRFRLAACAAFLKPQGSADSALRYSHSV